MNRKTKMFVCFFVALFILSLVGMLVTQEPAKTMMKNYREGSPFNPGIHNLLQGY